LRERSSRREKCESECERESEDGCVGVSVWVKLFGRNIILFWGLVRELLGLSWGSFLGCCGSWSGDSEGDLGGVYVEDEWIVSGG